MSLMFFFKSDYFYSYLNDIELFINSKNFIRHKNVIDHQYLWRLYLKRLFR